METKDKKDLMELMGLNEEQLREMGIDEAYNRFLERYKKLKAETANNV